MLNVPNHWVLVTNMHDGPPNLVQVLDSLSQKPDQGFAHAVAAVFRAREPNFSLEWPRIAQQKDGDYALALATAVCQGENPQNSKFVCQVEKTFLSCKRRHEFLEQAKNYSEFQGMRGYLIQRFENEASTVFPREILNTVNVGIAQHRFHQVMCSC